MWAQGRPIACLAWSSAPRHLGSRDRYIGWSAEARRRNIRFIAYNTRFLILPWVQVPHLASHILGKVTRALSDDWERMYGHPVYFAETFIDPGRFRGTCYRAANWQLLGLTTGRGKNDQTNKPNRPIKEILGLALDATFPRVAQPVMTMRRRVEVNLDELDQIIDRGTRAPLSESEGQKLKAVIHAMAEKLVRKRNTEKTSAVLPPDATPADNPEGGESASAGHGRHGAAAFTGASRVSCRARHAPRR